MKYLATFSRTASEAATVAFLFRILTTHCVSSAISIFLITLELIENNNEISPVTTRMENDSNIVRSLGLVQIMERHTGENIAEVVKQILRAFDIPISKIFAVTTDNGSNMIKQTTVAI